MRLRFAIWSLWSLCLPVNRRNRRCFRCWTGRARAWADACCGAACSRPRWTRRRSKRAWVRLQTVIKDLERQVLQRAIALWGDRPNEEIARLLGTSRRVLELRLAEFEIEKKR